MIVLLMFWYVSVEILNGLADKNWITYTYQPKNYFNI